MKSKLKYRLVLALLAMLPGCDLKLTGGSNPGDDQPEIQTEILAVLIEPDPVVAGDTATFTCIIRDSLDTRFQVSMVFGRRFPRHYEYESIAPESSR
jgi:hypothetical protein